MTTRVSRKDALKTLLPMIEERRGHKERSVPVFVAVVGGSASGKGHLIDDLLGWLNGPDGLGGLAEVLPLDNYYLGAAERRLRRAPHFDHPDAIDLRQAADQLAAMRVGATVKIPRYDFSVGERAGYENFDVKRIVLIDGLFALYDDAIRTLVDVAVFIDSDHYSSMLRRLFRDSGPGGRTKQSSREVLEQYFTQVWPSKTRFIDPTAAYADVIVESRYDADTEAGRAGPMQYQLKARAPMLSDAAVAFLTGASRLGGEIRQVDRFMRLKGAGERGDILRHRLEPDADGDVLMTYKGPLVAGADANVRSRPVSSSIALPREALRWFQDDYEVEATLEKRRILYQAGGLLIARDRVKNLGSFFEVRSGSDAAQAGRLCSLLSKLCPGEPQTDASYLDLWRARQGPSASP